MTKRYLLAVVAAGVLLLLNSQAFAQAEAGVPSLIIPPGARANGLGEAYVAIADDATAMSTNPAGLAFIDGQRFDMTALIALPRVSVSGPSASVVTASA